MVASSAAWRLLLLLFALAIGYGCGSSEDKQTLRGLQEENRLLKERLAELQQLSQALRTDKQENVSELKEEHKDQLTKLRELQQDKIAQLERAITDLRLELSSAQRERLALQEIVDQRPRQQQAAHIRFGIERLVWLALLTSALAALLLVASKYTRLHRQVAQVLLQRVALAQREGDQP
ncbi:MAG TPA: hypothetical protein VG099_11540 [Gemmataceae bacterium]|jgi:hypothetical protein|nr:hypothetical protein [Gemmataceae bacterium]